MANDPSHEFGEMMSAVIYILMFSLAIAMGYYTYKEKVSFDFKYGEGLIGDISKLNYVLHASSLTEGSNVKIPYVIVPQHTANTYNVPSNKLFELYATRNEKVSLIFRYYDPLNGNLIEQTILQGDRDLILNYPVVYKLYVGDEPIYVAGSVVLGVKE